MSPPPRLAAPSPARLRLRFLTVALLLGLALGCSRHPAPPAAPPPYETLLLLLSDFRRASQTDLYRNDTPLDVTGQNLFRATLARLDYFESNNPGIDVDIVNFTRAQARARLGDYAGAVKAYNLVAAFDESPLAPKAKERIEILRLLKEASDPVEKIDRLDRYFATLETKQKQLKALEKRFEGSHDAILARMTDDAIYARGRHEKPLATEVRERVLSCGYDVVEAVVHIEPCEEHDHT